MSKVNIHINGVIGEDTTFAGVLSQYKAVDEPTAVNVFINSPGGYVNEGESIYNFLNNLDIPVTTIATKAYSIAAQIFMAGDTRLVEDVDKPLMIHLPLIKDLTANSDTLIAIAEDLKELEQKFISFYSEALDLDEEAVADLLKNDTFISVDEAISLGFATGKKEPLNAVAFFNEPEPKNKNTMSDNDSLIKKIALKLGVLTEAAKTVNLILQDANGTEVNFPDLEAGDKPKPGDKATIDGSDADGEIVMPTGETFVFEKGELTEIKPAEDDKDDEGSEGESSEGNNSNSGPVAEVIKEVLKWEIEVDQNGIKEGDQLTRTWEDETYNIGAGEWELSDGRKIITDANGVVVLVKDPEGEPQPEANAGEDEDEDLTAKVIDQLAGEVESLKKMIASKDIDEDPRPQRTKSYAEMTPLERYRATKKQFQ